MTTHLMRDAVTHCRFTRQARSDTGPGIVAHLREMHTSHGDVAIAANGAACEGPVGNLSQSQN